MGFRLANTQRIIWFNKPHLMFAFMFSIWSDLTPRLDWNDLTSYYNYIIVEDVFKDYFYLSLMRNSL